MYSSILNLSHQNQLKIRKMKIVPYFNFIHCDEDLLADVPNDLR